MSEDQVIQLHKLEYDFVAKEVLRNGGDLAAALHRASENALVTARAFTLVVVIPSAMISVVLLGALFVSFDWSLPSWTPWVLSGHLVLAALALLFSIYAKKNARRIARSRDQYLETVRDHDGSQVIKFEGTVGAPRSNRTWAGGHVPREEDPTDD